MKIVMQRITSRGAAPAMEHELQLVSPAPHTLDSRLRLVRGADMLQHNHGGSCCALVLLNAAGPGFTWLSIA
jgi:hypothetical protein